MTFEDILVPGRECNECTVCCINLQINEPELQKKADEPCPNLSSGKGCAIYNDRPGVCRTWYCGWRIMPFVNEDMRPDKSRILIRTDGTPLFIFQPLEKDSVPRLLDEKVMEAIATVVLNDFKAQLSIPTHLGYCNAISEVNDALKPALSTLNLDQARKTMMNIISSAACSSTLRVQN